MKKPTNPFVYYVLGGLANALFQGILYDYWGLEKTIQKIRDHWVDSTVYLWFEIPAFIAVCFVFSYFYNKDKELRND